MAIIVKFDGVDKTSVVSLENFKIDNILTSQVDTCSLVVKKHSGQPFAPGLTDELVISEDGTKIFGGVIVKSVERLEGGNTIVYDIQASDYTRLADRKLVGESYENKTVKEIITDIVSDYLSGFTITNVNCDVEIDYIAFNYEPFSQCLQRLAKLVGYDWYIDYDKDIHFFSHETNPSPFNLTDDNGNYILDSLLIDRDVRQLKNVVYVRGGEYLADWFTENQFGDGTKKDFKLAYKYNGIEVKVNTVAQSVGVDYVDDPSGYDCLYNFQEKIIKFKATNIPANGIAVDISGYPYVPVIVEAKDQDSINDYGEYWFRIIDKTIKTKKAARERGGGELLAYSQTLSEATFETNQDGLRSGQIINVQSTLRGVDEDFIINRVSATMNTYDKMKYKVSLITTKTMGIIELLQKMLIADDRIITVSEDEVIDKLWSGLDSFGIQEELYNWTSTSPPWYVKDGNVPIGICGFCEAS